MNRLWKLSLVIVTIIIFDQFTKGSVQSSFQLGESIPIIDGFFNFTYVRNPGAAFGMGAYAGKWVKNIFFLWIPVLACFWLMWLMFTTRNKSLFECTTYSLILAGAIGNLIDRFSMGYVVDFLDFYIGTSHFPAFNIADSSITIGAFMLGYVFLFIQPKEEKAAKELQEAQANEENKKA